MLSTSAMRDASSLLACTVALYLGQMEDADYIPTLEAVLSDLSLHPIVRHKAAQALGFLGLDSCVPVLLRSLNSDPAQEVQETCELALSRIAELKKASPLYSGYFVLRYPAAPACCRSIPILRELLDEDSSLYERHAVLFALSIFENDVNMEAMSTSTIIEARGATSILLWYWVAYVLSLKRSKNAIDALCDILGETSENPIIREKAVQGLLSTKGLEDDAGFISLLEKFAALDPDLIVLQSCEVALKRIEFRKSGKLIFEHALVKHMKQRKQEKMEFINRLLNRRPLPEELKLVA